ncbi:MAG TPA: hypothetical protein VET45_00060 [Candidatus Binatia bacterium]|nr:hypothetical protein [Candidatus Binatia bacterium]
MMNSCVALAAVLCVTMAVPARSHGQVFLASKPHPEFLVGPLFVVANVSPGLGPVTVNLSWSLTTGPAPRKVDIAQDLYLLWPAETAESTAPGPAEPQLVREVEVRGLDVVGSGRLVLRRRDRMQLGTAALGEPIPVVVSYVNFTRPGGQSGVVSYIKIPWTPTLSDPLSIVTLVLPLRGLIVPKAGTWLEDLFWGRRQVLTTGFGDLGPPALGLFALYYERRDRMVHLAREYSLVIANFGDSDHLKIEEISPATAVRRQSRVRAGAEVVALTLLPSQDITTQSLRVQFHYFSGRINWRPIVISAVILLVTNFAGVLMLSTDVHRRIRRRRRARRRFGAAAAAPNGGVPSRETLVTLIPAGTRYDEVVARFGQPDEEHERVTPPGRRTLLYRGTNGAEHHEVAIELSDDRVREVTCVTSR